MKKNIIFAAIVAAVTLVSCSQQEQTAMLDKNSTFTASIEQEFTRTTLASTNKVNWEYNDRININGAEYMAAPKNPATKAVFQYMKGDLPKRTPYCAIYPANLYTWNGYEFPSILEYKEGSLNTPMYAESNTEELCFKNICGVLHLSLNGIGKVARITVSADQNICGPFEVDESMTARLVAGIDNAEMMNHNTVTLDCGERGELLDEWDYKDFYIPLPAGEYTGLMITITGTNGAEFVKVASNNVNVQRNSIYSLNFTTVFTLKETLADYFLGLSADQANLTAATDEAMWSMTQSQIEASKNNPQKFFLPEIHTWDNAYAAIELIDKGLAYINNGMLTDVQGLTSAELYFLEAYLYFELFRAYGGVVPVLSGDFTPTTNDEMVGIITELGERCINNISTLSSKTITLVNNDDKHIEMIRPTKWAAQALLGRLYLYYASPLFSSTSDQSRWTKASTYLDAVINSGEVVLQSSYEGIWNAWGEDSNNKEILFGVRIKTKDNAYEGLHPTQSIVDQYGDGSGEKTFGMEYPNNSIPLYTEWDKSPYNFIKDHRFEVTIQTPLSTAGYSLLKHVAHIMPIIRYGEVLLNCAETYFNTGNNTKAREYVNQIRQRAGLAPISQLDNEDIDIIKQERLLELAFEGHRFWDVRRWKQGEDCFGIINAAVVTEQNEGPLLLTRTPINRAWSEKYYFYPVSRK